MVGPRRRIGRLEIPLGEGEESEKITPAPCRGRINDLGGGDGWGHPWPVLLMTTNHHAYRVTPGRASICERRLVLGGRMHDMLRQPAQ